MGRLGTLRCPILIVRGEHGQPAEVVEEMRKASARSQTVSIANAGHDVHLEQPEHFNAVLESFVDAL